MGAGWGFRFQAAQEGCWPVVPEGGYCYGWALELTAIERALRPGTTVVSVNFPHNPTGAVPDEDTWRRLVELCDERGIHQAVR